MKASLLQCVAMKEYYKETREARLQYKRTHYKANQTHYILKARQYRATRKRLIIEHYTSGLNHCRHCGEDDLDVLSVDHINDDGATHRKHVKAEVLYKWLIDNKYPEGFQILCWNCNHKKWVTQLPGRGGWNNNSMPTNEEIIRAITRVENLEATLATLESRVQSLEQSIAAANAKVETLNTFYGGALGDTTGRLLAILDKVTGGTPPTV